jgi:hypothetical protein
MHALPDILRVFGSHPGRPSVRREGEKARAKPHGSSHEKVVEQRVGRRIHQR